MMNTCKQLIFDALELIASTATSTHELAMVDLILKTPAFEDEKTSSSRFALVDDADVRRFQEANQSASTKKNTRWGIKIFQGY